MPRTVRLVVPNRARAVLARVSALSDADQHALLDAFSDASAPSTLPELSARAADVIGARQADQLIREVIGLVSLAATHSYDLSDVAAAVATSDRLDLDDEARQRLQVTMNALLQSSAIITIGKAVDLYQEQPNVLHTVRLVSDIRPLISADADHVDGAVVIHHLRLSYFSDGISTDLDLAIDNEDIEELIAALRRAQLKEDLLHQFLETAAVPVYDTSSN